MKEILVIALLAIAVSACSIRSNTISSGKTSASSLTEDEKHRLYSAALAASESPLDTDIFKDVCKNIGIFDANGKPNDKYMAFVQEHVDWGMKPEADDFRREINTKDKAREYIKKYLP